MCVNWGYYRLAGVTRKESIEEMTHAEKCMERILYLEGTPNMSDYFKINIGSNVLDQLNNDLQLEYDAVKRLNKGIVLCRDLKDDGSRELLKSILLDEEHRSEEHTSELQSLTNLVCRLLLEKKKK